MTEVPSATLSLKKFRSGQCDEGSWSCVPIGSYVLVKQEHPPTRLHTKWKGPFRVVSFEVSE